MRYVSIPTVAPVPVEMLVAQAVAGGLLYALLNNNVLRVIDDDSGHDVATYRYPNERRAIDAFNELVAAAEAADRAM